MLSNVSKTREMSGENDNASREDIHSKAVRAGKRTYFFDVKSTRGNDLYLTITESKRRYSDDGKFSYEKHKLFLYKEDFDKFAEGLKETIDKIEELRNDTNGRFASNNVDGPIENHSAAAPEASTQEVPAPSENGLAESSSTGQFTDVSFEDLESSPTEKENKQA